MKGIPSRARAQPIEVELVVAEIVVTEAPPPGPSAMNRPPELPGVEEPESARAATPPSAEAPPPEPPPVERAPPPAPPRASPAPRPPAREWNIWDLEQRARERSGDALRDEEWAAIFLHLRQFANADGVLPMQFDELVRESFSELIQAA